MAGKSKKSPAPPKQHLVVEVEVLQNGISVASCKSPYGKTGTIKLSPNSSGDLIIPFYPMVGEVEIVRSRGGKTYLTLDRDWEGFAVSQGQVTEFKKNDRTQRQIPLQKGDYASLVHNDLRLLIRIGIEKEKPTIKLDKNYRGTIPALFLRDPSELIGFAIGAFFAVVVCGGVAGGMLKRDLERPSAFEELDDRYTLPFIAPEHFSTAPEALQANLNRNDYVGSVVNYYRSQVAVFMGWNLIDKRYVYPASAELYDEIFAAERKKIREVAKIQKKTQDLALEKPLMGVISVPAVRGESIDGSFLRLLDKINLQHLALNHNLEIRKKIVKEFPRDPSYDFNQYKDDKNRLAADSTKEALSRIRTFNDLSDEEDMYFKADALAAKSSSRQKTLQLASQVTEPIQVQYASPIEIPGGVSWVSFLSGIDYFLSDEKLQQLEAVDYGEQKRLAATKIREPLIGEIEPTLVQRAIEKHSFELQLCFELALRRNQLTRGIMEWKWRIDSRGDISEIDLVSSSIKDTRMVQCIREKMARWRFPRPRRGSVEVSFPFEFNPSRG